jgi:hypothetical protein
MNPQRPRTGQWGPLGVPLSVRFTNRTRNRTALSVNRTPNRTPFTREPDTQPDKQADSLKRPNRTPNRTTTYFPTGTTQPFDPATNVRCDDYPAHQASHRREGRGWKCDVCNPPEATRFFAGARICGTCGSQEAICKSPSGGALIGNSVFRPSKSAKSAETPADGEDDYPPSAWDVTP